VVNLEGEAEGGSVVATVEAKTNSAVHVLLLLLEIPGSRVDSRRDGRGHEELGSVELLAEHLQGKKQPVQM